MTLAATSLSVEDKVEQAVGPHRPLDERRVKRPASRLSAKRANQRPTPRGPAGLRGRTAYGGGGPALKNRFEPDMTFVIEMVQFGTAGCRVAIEVQLVEVTSHAERIATGSATVPVRSVKVREHNS